MDNIQSYQGVEYLAADFIKEDNLSALRKASAIYIAAKDSFPNRLASLLNRRRRVLQPGTKINLMTAESAKKTILTQTIQQIEQSLTRIQQQSIDADNFTALAYAGQVSQEMKDDLTNLMKGLDSLASMAKNGTFSVTQGINTTAWNSILQRFYNVGQESGLYPFAQNIINGKAEAKDLATMFYRVSGKFGNQWGLIMEDIVAQLINTPEIQNLVVEKLSDAIDSTFKKISARTNTGTAIQGTLRYNGNAKPDSPMVGKPLTDVFFDISIDKNGTATLSTRIDETVGVSVKRYNLWNQAYGKYGMSLGSIATNKLKEKLFNAAVPPIYMYRGISSDKDAAAYFLLEDQEEDLFFSGLSDNTDLIVVNGILMNLADFLKQVNPGLKLDGFKNMYKAENFIPQQNVDDYINMVHATRVHAYTKQVQNIL